MDPEGNAAGLTQQELLRDVHCKALEQDRNEAATSGKPLAYVASRNGHPEVLRVLHVARADLTAQKTNGASAVYVASKRGHLEVSSWNFSNATNEISSMLRVTYSCTRSK